MGAMVGASMLGKLGLPGANAGGAGGGTSGGYQPRMFGARANPNSTTNTADNTDASGISGRASYNARFGAGINPTTSHEFGSNRKFTGSMTEAFGPGSGSIKSEETKTTGFIPTKTV